MDSEIDAILEQAEKSQALRDSEISSSTNEEKQEPANPDPVNKVDSGPETTNQTSPDLVEKLPAEQESTPSEEKEKVEENLSSDEDDQTIRVEASDYGEPDLQPSNKPQNVVPEISEKQDEQAPTDNVENKPDENIIEPAQPPQPTVDTTSEVAKTDNTEESLSKVEANVVDAKPSEREPQKPETSLPSSGSQFSWVTFFSEGFSKEDAQTYAKIFEENQLTERDIADLDHELLKSMDFNVAKVRLTIIKLKTKYSSR